MYESEKIKNVKNITKGKILHVDGDKKYSKKAYDYYKKAGLNAIVRNIPEYRQPQYIYRLLKIYQPDIVIITGHDRILSRAKRLDDISNYKSSKYFARCVQIAREYEKQKGTRFVIYAGACQSYFELLIKSGANFASSPERIMIDFMDPIIVAEKVASTIDTRYITIEDISKYIRDGKKGINGVGARGKMRFS